MYQRLDPATRLASYSRATDSPNPECQVCSDDSQTILLLKVKDYSTFDLSQLQELLMSEKSLSLSPTSQMVSFDSKIIYEYDHEMVTDNDPDDRAEISLNQKRLLKSF